MIGIFWLLSLAAVAFGVSFARQRRPHASLNSAVALVVVSVAAMVYSRISTGEVDLYSLFLLGIGAIVIIVSNQVVERRDARE